MHLHAKLLTPEDYPNWDELVRQSPQGSPFSLTGYLDAWGRRYQLLAAISDGRLVGGVPLVRGIAGAYSTPLFVKFGGVLLAPMEGSALTRDTREMEIQEVLLDALESCWTFEYNFHPAFTNWLPFKWRGYSQTSLYTFQIDAAQAGGWQHGAHPRVRRAAKGARAKGVSCAPVPRLDSGLYRLLMAPYEKQGARAPVGEAALVHAEGRLAALGMSRTWVAREGGGRPVCCVLAVEDGRCVYLLLHGCAPGAPAGANTLLISTVIDDALGRGLSFDFEGSVIRPIEQFYRGFGGRRVAYSRIWRPHPFNQLRRGALVLAKRALGYER